MLKSRGFRKEKLYSHDNTPGEAVTGPAAIMKPFDSRSRCDCTSSLVTNPSFLNRLRNGAPSFLLEGVGSRLC